MIQNRRKHKVNKRSVKYLVVESMGVEGIVKVYELGEVAQGGKSAFADMIPVMSQMATSVSLRSQEGHCDHLPGEFICLQ